MSNAGRGSIWALIALLFGVSALGVCGAVLLIFGLSPGPSTMTEADLSDAGQRKLINDYSPVPLPASATGIRLEHASFQDTYFEASFQLSEPDFGPYVEALERETEKKNGPPEPGSNSFWHEADATTRTVKFIWASN